MTLLLVVLAVLGAGFVVVMALGRFTRPGESALPDNDKPPEAHAAQASDPAQAGNPVQAGGQADDDGALVRRWKRGEVPRVRGLVEPAQNLPPVLLPDDPRPGDVDRLRFSAGFRGYRMDQVDEVLDILRDALTAKEQRLTELEKLTGLGKDPVTEHESGPEDISGSDEDPGEGHSPHGAGS